jgi:putative DNA primase/helicase
MYDLKAQSLIYEGYRKGKEGKKPKDNKLYAYEDVKDLPCYGAQCKENIIDVSFDDIELFDQILNILEDTDIITYALYSPHGGHTYWRYDKRIKDGHDIILSLGVKADIHSKGTYIPLKVDGEERKEIYDDIADIPELPEWLSPARTGQDLWQMKEGDGRNDALSRHAFALGKIRLDEDQIKEIYKMINKYILKDKMSEDEINTILRPETFQKISTNIFFDDNGRFMTNIFSRYMIQEQNTIYTNGQLCIYDPQRGFYDPNMRLIKHTMIQLFENIPMNKRNEAYDYLTIEAPQKEQSSRRYILFKNGIYDLEEQKLLPHSPEYVISNQIPWNYNPEAYSELVDKTLNKLACNDMQIRKLIEECIGYCFYRDSKLGKCFILTGEKNNGKSTFIFMLNTLLGDDNYSSVDITNLARELDIASLANKLANIKDDIADNYMDGLNVSLFKQVATGNRCRGKFLYNDPFDFYPYATLIFSANNIPRIKDPTGAVTKRMVIIPFNAVFTSDDPDYDPFINEKLCQEECMEYLVKIGIDALIGVIMRNGFSECDASNKEMEIYKLNNDSVLSFILEYGSENIENQTISSVYSAYELHCSNNGLKPNTQIMMSKKIKTALGYDVKRNRINGKLYSVYVKE